MPRAPRRPTHGQLVPLTPPEPPPADPQAEAIAAFAAATDRLAAAAEQAVARLGPAADTVHGLGDRLDKLCAWLKGMKPWLIGAAVLLASRLMENPEDLGRLLQALTSAAQAATLGPAP